MKYNLINRLIKLFLLFSTTIIYCQTSTYPSLYKKYWYFKSRLNNDFVKVGTNDGESIPFNQRGLFSTSFTNQNAELFVGDGTSTLGYYIAVLATECKLLAQNNQDTKKTIHELFCALNAVNRLDYVAETYFGNES